MIRSLLSQHWLVSTTAATGCWALSDVCCDCCIGQGNSSAQDLDSSPSPSLGKKRPVAVAEESEEDDGRLTSEQNAMMSAAVSFCSAVTLMKCCSVAPWQDRDTVIGLCAGAVHFVAYAVELKAYRTASSTVITPLLQLSAVWMTFLRALLPLFATTMPTTPRVVAAGGEPGRSVKEENPDIEALYVATAAMKPAHLLAVFFIFVGGFLPAAKGKISRFTEPSFYRQEAVRCCVVGELLVCVYNALLHMCTFRLDDDDNVSVIEAAASHADVLRFFAVSRAGTSAACILAIVTGQASGFSFADVADFSSRKPTYLLISLAGECLSVAGVLIVMFSYASFHEPAVVNAAEGGVQQLLNLCFALTFRYFCKVGRKIEHTKTKLVSFILVSAGLALSAI